MIFLLYRVIFFLYRLVSRLLAFGPLQALVCWRAWRGREDPARLKERQGFASQPRPEGQLVWVHAASNGEAMAALPVIERLRENHPGLCVLMTTGTRTSAQMLAPCLDERFIHQFLPHDVPAYVARFLDHWQPTLGLLIEQDIWPNLISECRKWGIPLYLANARLSVKSFNLWKLIPGVAPPFFSAFSMVFALDSAQAARFQALGAKEVKITGNLKQDAPAPPANPQEYQTLKAAIGDRPVWLFALSHPGEEELALTLHQKLVQEFSGLLTIIAPRHPVRGGEIMALVEQAGLKSAQRSKKQELAPEDEVYLADTTGEMGLFYRLAPAGVLGGSFVPGPGGHNPLEAVKCGMACIVGPHMESQQVLIAPLLEAGGIRQVDSVAACEEELRLLLQDQQVRQTRSTAAMTTLDALPSVSAEIYQHLAEYLGRIRG